MRKNKMMRAASGILVATLMTTSIISGTFAKYTTSAAGEDSARVAKWGFADSSSITITDLFKNAYDSTVKSSTDVIAPGTKGEATFEFGYTDPTTKPEVKYNFKVDTTGSDCKDDIKNNSNIKWKLDGTECANWDELLKKIAALDGEDNVANKGKDYEAGTLPSDFDGTKTHKIEWEWVFEDKTSETAKKDQDVKDTAMGNKAPLDDVTIKITITATQID